MIRIDVRQGSEAWHQARLSIPTASQFHRIISPRTMKPSASGTKYMHELLAERLLGTPIDSASSEFMERGKALEDEAVAWYELQRGVDTERLGFALTDDRRAGCSPDRLVGADGGLEIKVPSAAVHVGYLLGDPGDDHRAQVQGCLYVTGRKWWDVLSYNPLMESALVRVERDEEFIGALDAALGVFYEHMEQAWAHLEPLARRTEVA